MPMTRSRRTWLGPLAFAAGLACLAGCRNAGALPAGPGLLGMGEKGHTALSPRQVADVQVGYARSLEKRGEQEQALARYGEAVKHDPERADAWGRLAVLHDRQGRFGESAQMYARALALHPGDPDVYCNVGYSFYLQQRWAEAEMNLRQAIALRPDHARAHNNLGLVLARTGRDDLALAEFRKAGCGEADARVNLAFALSLERRWPEAQRNYRQALAANASSAPARKGLKELEAVMAKASYSEPATPPPVEGVGVPVSYWEVSDRPDGREGER